MCIIAYSPKGSTIKEETIRIMFKGNPDGAGLMWKPSEFGPVEIRKGFFKVEDLIKAYNEIPVECEKAIHCRIATSGKVSVACCHPFPVRSKADAMMEARDRAEIALMHNGMINYCTPVQGMKSPYSDSMLFAKRFLYPLAKQLDQECIQELIENSTTSRLLIMRQGKETLTLGDWKFEDGVYYSNGNYKERPVTTYGNWWNNYYGGYSYTNAKGGATSGKKPASVATPYDGYSIYDDECFGYGHEIDEDTVESLAALRSEKGSPIERHFWVDLKVENGWSEDMLIDSVCEALEVNGFLMCDYNLEHYDDEGYSVLSMEVVSDGEDFPSTMSSVAGCSVIYSTPL